VAALETFVTSGTAQDVPMLARLASVATDSSVRDTAFEVLRLMNAEGTNQAFRSLMSEEKSLTPVLVQSALARRSPEFVPAFLEAAESSNPAIRLEAFKALEIMATDTDAESLVRLLSKTRPGDEREMASRAVWMSCQKISDPSQRAGPLLRALATVDAAGKSALLPALARLGGKESLAAVHAAMASEDQVVRNAGYRALANWPDAGVAEELLNVVKTSDVETYRIWALRAYARVISLPNERPPQKTFEMLSGAMKLARRVEDKKLIVSRLASVRVPGALALLVSYLDSPELKDAAVPAVFTLAKGLSQSHPDRAKAALEKVRPLVKDSATLQQIPKVLRGIEARKREQKE
jgi:HEAT repeat protein